jgi:predicted methyltransferase MtxX (methanogen marker protein 4)
VEAWLIHCGGVLMGGGTSVGAVVRMRGGDYVETSPVRTDQRAQEDHE